MWRASEGPKIEVLKNAYKDKDLDQNFKESSKDFKR